MQNTKNKILEMQAPEIHHSEETLARYHRRLLSQLRTNKSPFLLSYLHKINPSEHPSPLCPLCSDQTHDTIHLFQCIHTDNTYSNILMEQSLRQAELLDTWRRALEERSQGRRQTGSAPRLILGWATTTTNAEFNVSFTVKRLHQRRPTDG